MSESYVAVDPAHIKKEKAKARELRQSLWWRQQVGRGICHYCEQKFKPSELTMEHILPLGRGGKTSKKNCVPCCKECNTKKGAKTKVELALEEMQRGKTQDSDSE